MENNEKAHLEAQLLIKDSIIARLSEQIGSMSVNVARLETERETILQAYNHTLVESATEEEEVDEEKGD